MTPIPRGLALDVDDTLSNTVTPYFDLLRENFGNPENLTTQEIVAKYGHGSRVPYWKTEEIRIWKRTIFDDPKFYDTLELHENSNHIVEKINSIIPISCYITARPTFVIEATKAWLKKHGFPEREVIARPPEYEDGNKWKAEELVKLYPNIVGIVDDDPRLISALPKEYQGAVFLYSHLEYDQETPLNVIPCKDWEAVYDKIQKQAHLFGRA